MTMLITGLGTSVPAGKITQTVAYEATHQLCCDSDEHRRVMELIYQGAGVEQRSTVLLQDHENSPDLDEGFYARRSHEDDRGPTTRDRMQKFEDCSLGLALESSEAALAHADQDVSEITHLVTVSCSGFHAPGFDIGLIEELGLSRETSRTHVGFMGCHGSFNALRWPSRTSKQIPRRSSWFVLSNCAVCIITTAGRRKR